MTKTQRNYAVLRDRDDGDYHIAWPTKDRSGKINGIKRTKNYGVDGEELGEQYDSCYGFDIYEFTGNPDQIRQDMEAVELLGSSLDRNIGRRIDDYYSNLTSKGGNQANVAAAADD